MTGQELNKLVRVLRTETGMILPSRTSVEDFILNIADALDGIDKYNSLVENLRELTYDMDDVETDDILKYGTFN